jgi:alcohol dehydrogenase class IV
VRWLQDLQQAIGVPSRLRDLGIPQDQLAAVAEKTLHERGLAYNPRSVQNAQELEAILLAAW